jgi:hypothetical protein
VLTEIRKIIERSIAGDDDTRRTFSSARAAIGAWAQWRDDGASIKSTSDPARFDAVPGGRRRLFDGREHLLEVEAAIDRACREHHRGEVIARAALTLFVIGRSVLRVVGLPEQKRKGRIMVREACTQDEIDRACLVFEVPEKSMRRYSREVIAHVGDVLEAKEIVRAMRTRKREEDTMASQFNIDRGFDLEGKKAIAEHLGVSISTVDRLREEEGLPVYNSLVGRIVASKRELREWLDQRERRAS